MVKALIIEQLESDGTLRTLCMQPADHDTVVAFATQYDEPRTGPFHFLEEADEQRFREGFANCRSRRLNYPNFSGEGDSFHFETNWYGIPTEPYVLSYYALSLPEFAIPTSVSVSDPHRVDHEYHRYVTRDNDRNRYVIYVECASPQRRFDFDLACDFAIDSIAFSTSAYQDTDSSAHSYQRDDWKHFLHGPEREKVQNFFIGGVHTSDTYLVGQGGAVGPYAQSSNSTFHQIRQERAEVVDKPLTPNLVHPYPLQANFTGRVEERKELTTWLNNDEHPIYQLVAMGGMGKSALTWYWLIKDVLVATDLNLDGVMWWSFYEGESSFTAFVDDALKYVSGQPIDTEAFPATYDREQELRKHLQAKRVLFVLDGFERQLCDYATLYASYQTEDPGTRSRQARGCIDPNAARFLRALSGGATRVKVLLTTRLPVSDLEDHGGAALACVMKRDLNDLAPNDSVAFMRAQGVTKGTNTEVLNACANYGYHPLSLRLLSGLIVQDPRTPGDIAGAPHHDVHDDLIQRRHHVLEQSYNALQEAERTFLSQLAAFRSPMNYDALTIFNRFSSEDIFNTALFDLIGRGLLQRNITTNRYDLHPIVRHYCYDRLTDKTGAHSALRNYFGRMSSKDEEKVRGIEDVAPQIELYHHTVCSGRFEEAAQLFRDRLASVLYYRLSEYQTCVQLLSLLSAKLGPSSTPNNWFFRVQNMLANSYSFCGQPKNAVSIFESVIAHDRQHDKSDLVISLANLATMAQMVQGKLEIAERNIRLSIELATETKQEHQWAFGHFMLGYLLPFRGAFDEASQELDIAYNIVEGWQRKQALSNIWIGRSLLLSLRADTRGALEAAQRALAFSDDVGYERDGIWAQWVYASALVTETQHFDKAAAHLTSALTRCRRISLVEFEPSILLSWARWHLAKGNVGDALSHAVEALEIADRSEYRLKQADIHNFLAQLALDAGDRTRARHHAEIAKERAWCDGPTYCYKPALDQAEEVLRELESA